MGIDVFKTAKRVRLRDDLVMVVRPVGTSMLTRIQIAAGLADGLIGTHNLTMQLAVQVAVLGVEGNLLGKDGDRVAFRRVQAPVMNGVRLGEIATEEVFDALGDAEIVFIKAVACGEMTPEQVEETIAKMGGHRSGGGVDGVAGERAVGEKGVSERVKP